MRLFMIPLFFTLLFNSGCSKRKSDRSILYDRLHNHKVIKSAFWKESVNLPLEKKLHVVPDELIEYIELDNLYNNFDAKPKREALTLKQNKIFIDAIKEIPKSIRTILNSKLTGISFVSGLGSSGLAEQLLDAESGFMVFDTRLVKLSANELCAWKIRSAFTYDNSIKIKCIIGTQGDISPKDGLLHILLHEIGHILNIGSSLLPDWSAWKNVHRYRKDDDYPFSQLSWVHPDGERTKFDYWFKERGEIQSYGGGMDKDKVSHIFQQLKKTNFPTLYSTRSSWEDWADSFANYVFVVMLKKKYRIEIYKNEKLVMEYGSCWEEERCQKKRQIIEKFLNLN
jgi:hypothetical protein